MSARDELSERLRDLLVAESDVREVSMFGGRAFMLHEKMIVSVLKDGGLLVRADPASHDELCRQLGAAQAEMGKGRSMGPGWIEVSAAAVADEAGLGFWFDAAVAYNRSQTGKG